MQPCRAAAAGSPARAGGRRRCRDPGGSCGGAGTGLQRFSPTRSKYKPAVAGGLCRQRVSAKAPLQTSWAPYQNCPSIGPCCVLPASKGCLSRLCSAVGKGESRRRGSVGSTAAPGSEHRRGKRKRGPGVPFRGKKSSFYVSLLTVQK